MKSMRSTVQNVFLVLLSALLALAAGVSHAALGELPERFSAGSEGVASTVSTNATNHVLRTTTFANGTQVNEYISAQGVVFAVTWEGPFLPDLKALLGKYFAAFTAESARLPKAGRAPIVLSTAEVTIYSGGHMRAFEGSAWLPNAFPPGFTANDVR